MRSFSPLIDTLANFNWSPSNIWSKNKCPWVLLTAVPGLKKFIRFADRETLFTKSSKIHANADRNHKGRIYLFLALCTTPHPRCTALTRPGCQTRPQQRCPKRSKSLPRFISFAKNLFWGRARLTGNTAPPPYFCSWGQ